MAARGTRICSTAFAAVAGEKIETLSSHLRAAGVRDAHDVALRLVDTLKADDPWAELLCLPTVLLERLFLPPRLEPVSAAKLIRYIVHRSEEVEEQRSSALGPLRSLLLARDPVANLKSLARLAAIESSAQHPLPTALSSSVQEREPIFSGDDLPAYRQKLRLWASRTPAEELSRRLESLRRQALSPAVELQRTDILAQALSQQQSDAKMQYQELGDIVHDLRTRARLLHSQMLLQLQFQQSFIAQKSQRPASDGGSDSNIYDNHDDEEEEEEEGVHKEQGTQEGAQSCDTEVVLKKKGQSKGLFKDLDRIANKSKTPGVGWSESEDRELYTLQNLHGNKWAKIAGLMSTERNDNGVKNRFSSGAFRKFCEKNCLPHAGLGGPKKLLMVEEGSSSSSNIPGVEKVQNQSEQPAVGRRKNKRDYAALHSSGEGDSGGNDGHEVENEVPSPNCMLPGPRDHRRAQKQMPDVTQNDDHVSRTATLQKTSKIWKGKKLKVA